MRSIRYPHASFTPYEFNWQIDLAPKTNVAQAQFPAQTFFVKTLEQPGSKRRMNLDRSADDRARQVTGNQFPPCLRDSVLKRHFHKLEF